MAKPSSSKSIKYRSVGTTYDGVKVIAPKTKPKLFTSADVKRAVAEALSKAAAPKEGRGSGKAGNVFIEPRAQKKYAVKLQGAKRASAIEDNLTDAVERAKELEPSKSPLIRRARNTSAGKAGQFRKA